MRRALLGLVLVLLPAACSSSSSDDEPAEPRAAEASLPAAPAACAGEPKPALEEQRRTAWSAARNAAPDRLWVSFARTVGPAELARLSAGLRLGSVLVTYPGTDAVATAVVTVTDARPTGVVEAVREQVGGALASGDVALGGALLTAEPAALARFVTANECLVHGIAVGDGPPPLARAVDPT